MKKVALVLSGCGVFDGAEIHESVLLLYAFERRGASVTFFAPDIPQAQVVNHLTGEIAESQTRNVREEAARIARGKVPSLSEFDPEEFDALVFVGGFGAAKNLCTFAFDGAEMSVNEDVQAAVRKMADIKKPLGFVCISPVIAAKVLKAKVTIGNDAKTAALINAMGGTHIDCPVFSYVKDDENNVYSTPAYMLAANTAELAQGLSSLVEAIL